MRKPLIVRVPSDAAQGPDSWVEFRRPTWKQTKEVGKMSDKLKKGNLDQQSAVFEPVTIQHIADWNWTDEDGNKLPFPTKSLDELTGEEAQFLIEQVAILYQGGTSDGGTEKN